MTLQETETLLENNANFELGAFEFQKVQLGTTLILNTNDGFLEGLIVGMNIKK